jgi:hypothetical protein
MPAKKATSKKRAVKKRSSKKRAVKKSSSPNLVAKKPPSPKLVLMPDVKVGSPFLRIGGPAESFPLLRAETLRLSGHDYLAVLADMWRPRGLKTNKVGTAFFSRHKCGDAFDCRQDVPYFVVQSEPSGGHQYFRIFLKTVAQAPVLSSPLVVNKTVKDYRGMTFKGWVLDFTALAGQYNWQRIPAHKGWSTKGPNYNKMEWWHYQQTQGLSFEQVMKILYG